MKDTNTSLNPISEAIRVTGLQELSRRMGLTYQAIRKWEKAGQVPPDRVGAFIAASDHPLTAAELLPELAELFQRDQAA